MFPSHQPDIGPDLEEAVRRLSGAGAILWLGEAPTRAVGWFEHLLVTDSADTAADWVTSERVLLAIVEVGFGTGGLKFARHLYETRPQLAVITLVPPSDTDALLELVNLGMAGVLLTPVDEGRLLDTVCRVLKSSRQTDQEFRYVTRLESEVRVRTEELREAQVQVIRLQEARDNMLALISHEIRTPLNGILGFIDLLRSPEFASEAAEFLVYVEDSARRLERSTRKALDFVSLSTGARALKRQPHRVRVLFDAAQEQLGSAGGQLSVDWQGNEMLVTDGELLVQVFRNLLENSVKYGGPASSISVSLAREGRWEVLRYGDDGPGFPQALLPTVFQPFSAGNIMHHSEGMGLGLALVDTIMLTLGGRAEAGNSPGGGAFVVLRFPISE